MVEHTLKSQLLAVIEYTQPSNNFVLALIIRILARYEKTIAPTIAPVATLRLWRPTNGL